MATVFSFEKICRSKTGDIIDDSRCGIKDCDRPYKNLNYLSGSGKSLAWNHSHHYNPTDRSWQRNHEKMGLPRERIAGQITFDNEDEWRDWQRKRDQPNSKLCGGLGYKFAQPPELKLSGYAFCPYNLYRSGRHPLNLNDAQDPLPPRDDPNFPYVQHEPVGFYGYYHNELDVHNNGGFRFTRREPSTPCACKGSVLMH